MARDDEALFETGTEGMPSKKKMLTMEDVAKHLQKEFPEEIADAKKYLCAAKIADSANDHHDCHYLLEMAKDEYTHAVFIHDFMERHGMSIPEAQEKCFVELKAEMAEFFLSGSL